jgi:metallo-beta-lactamase class B
MTVSESGKILNVVIVGSANVNSGYVLVNNSKYPQIAADYARQFQVLHALPCDVFLGAHGAYFDMDEKLARRKPGTPNPIIDPAGYRAFVDDREQAFRKELDRQEALKR